MPDPTRVLLIHGPDDRLLPPLTALLTALGLHPLAWEQALPRAGQPAAGVEALLAAAFAQAQAVLVLPDSDGPALFLAGLVWARHPQRTILLQMGQEQPFGAVAAGVVLVLDDSPPRRQDLAQRLTQAGCSVNLGNGAWLRAGDFAAALHPGPPPPDADMDRILVEISNSYANSLPPERLAQTLSLPPARLKACLVGLLKLGYLGHRTDEFGVTFYNVQPPGTDYLLGKRLM